MHGLGFRWRTLGFDDCLRLVVINKVLGKCLLCRGLGLPAQWLVKSELVHLLAREARNELAVEGGRRCLYTDSASEHLVKSPLQAHI